MTTEDDKLVLYLPLTGGIAPRQAAGVRITNHHVSAGADYASFNGRDSYLKIDSCPSLQLGEDDFSISVQVWTRRNLEGVVGDLVSNFDPLRRCGFNLTVKHHAGAVTSQTNYRNLHFELDNGTEPQWYDYGRPGDAVAVWSLAVYEGNLYAGTYEQAANGAGRVHRYLGGQNWEARGPLDGSNTVSALAVFDDQLYAATMTADPHGSLLEPTKNVRPGGNVYRMNRDYTWTHCGKVCNENNIFGMTVFRGRLYAWPAYAKGIYRYNGGMTWERITSPDSRLFALAPYHGKLYATANRLGLLDPNVTHAGPHGDPSVQPIVGKDGAFCWTANGSWIGCGNQAKETQIYSIAIHAGRMYVGTWPGGKVFRYEGERSWHDCGQLGEEAEIMGMAVYNGMLYAGALPTASIYRYQADNDWKCVGQVDHTPDVPLRRAITMAVFQGRLCVGTLPSGRAWAMETGQVASHDWPLPPDWHHVVAMRRQGALDLYLDGQLVAQSRQRLPLLNVSTNVPWLVGFGRHDYFDGRMRELRVYRRALTNREVQGLAKMAM